MKRFFTLMGLAAATIVSTNCTRELDVTSPEGGVEFSLTAVSEDTKTANDGMSTNWVANDDLNLFHAEAGSTTYIKDSKFVISEEDLSTGKFKGTLTAALEGGKSYDWYALYPYSSYIDSPENESGYLNIGSSTSSTAQVQEGNNSTAHLAGKYFPLYGKVTAVSAASPVSLTMKPALSVVKVHVTNNSGEPLTVNSVKFVAAEDIIGSYYISFVGDTPTFKASSSTYVSNTASLKVTDADAIADKASADFYFAVKPFTAENGSDLKLSVNGYEKTVTLTTDKVFPCGKIKTLNFNYDYVAPDFSGTYVILAKSGDNYFAMSGVPGSNKYMPKKDYSGTVDPASTVNIDDSDIVWVIAKTTDGYSLKNATNDKYLYYTSSDGGNSASLDSEPHYHVINPSTGGTVNILYSSNRMLRYNNSANPTRFVYYASSTGIADLILQPAKFVSVPKISVTSEVPVNVEANGATGLEVSYTITNPVAGKSISASCEETWIKNLSCATAGKVTFDVDANTGSKRTATVTLKYEGATDVTFTVEQEAAGATVFSCNFNSKTWGCASGGKISWTSDKEANQYSSPNVQVTLAYTGAGATTNETFTNISKVRISASTTSKGVGNITVKVGTGADQTICSLSKNTTATWYELDFSTSPVSGKVSFVVNCSTNSLYVQSFEITAEKKETK